MSGPQARPFKGRLGFDANNDKVVNLADPTVDQDGVNKRWFVANNSVQTFDPSRTYPAGFVVEYSDRLFKSKTAIASGTFNQNNWTEIHAFGRWLRVVSGYVAEPGDNLYVSTQAGSVTITLPTPAEDGDIVTILDEGYAKTNPILIDTNGSVYSINSQDVTQFIYLGGTWRVNREEKTTFKFSNTSFTAVPNSYNLVDTAAARTVTLPATPIEGQWVTIVDASNTAAAFNITVQGNGNNIGSATSYVMRRFAEQATFVYDSASGTWKVASNALENRIREVLTPLQSERVFVALDATNKAMTLPASVTGDWVEVITTAQDGSTTGSLVVTASSGTYFRTDGATQNTTTVRIKRRTSTLFLLKGSEWSVVQTDHLSAGGNISVGTMLKNSLVNLVSSTSDTIYLPQSDSLQIGDIVTAKLNITAGQRIIVSVQNGTTDLADGTTTTTWLPVDDGIVLTFIYRGYNGTKYIWESINHGAAYLQKTNNLSDLPNKATARTNLDVFSKGESDARFLPLHGTADNATQAANADKLDNLHAADFIQVKNPSVTAVDANSTTETRFSTNLNTPDATMWQVVVFIDAATGAQAQIALNLTTNAIASRVWTGSAWTAWTRLDANATAATATKLLTARTINGVSFDGTSNITVLANPLQTILPASTDLNTITTGGEYYCSVNATVATFTNCPTTNAFVMSVRNSAGTTQTIREYRNTPGSARSWFRNYSASSWGLWYQVFDEANPQPNITGNAATATKWNTARKLTLTGSASGEVTIDGTGDVTMAVTVTASGVGDIPISQVVGLQTSLDGKLGATAKAADSTLLNGVSGLDYKQIVAATNAGVDPDSVTTGLVLTNHANTPDSGTSYWYVSTEFYQSRSASVNRFQTAKQYNVSNSVYIRNYFSGAWTAWAQLTSITPGATLSVNVTGSAGSAATATKLTTPRTINGVAFDGTANITVSDDAKLPLAGGEMTGPILRRLSGFNFRKYDNVLNHTSDVSEVTGTLAIRLPAGLQNTMMKFRVNIYNYAGTNLSNLILEVAGYNYQNGWSNCTVTSNDTPSSVGVLGDTVRFANDGTYCYLLLGTTTSVWNYPKVSIENVTMGYSGSNSSIWDSPWTLSYLTSETGITVNVTSQLSPYSAKLDRANTFTKQMTFNTGSLYYMRNIQGNYGVMFYQDSATWYLMKTASGDPYGAYDTTRPFAVTMATGAVTLGTPVTCSSTLSVAGAVDVASTLTVAGATTFSGSTYNSNWYRSTGSTGWYNETYGGGMYMIDTTWVRVYGSKAMYVANEIAATGNITAYYSDERLKENLVKIPNALETVRSWTGYTYNANVTAQSFGYDPEKKEIGLLAQDVQRTTPEAVEPAPFDRTSTKGKSLTGKNYLTLKYDRLVPVLVEAIKEQDMEIQALKDQVKELIEAIKTLGR